MQLNLLQPRPLLTELTITIFLKMVGVASFSTILDVKTKGVARLSLKGVLYLHTEPGGGFLAAKFNVSFIESGS